MYHEMSHALGVRFFFFQRLGAIFIMRSISVHYDYSGHLHPFVPIVAGARGIPTCQVFDINNKK